MSHHLQDYHKSSGDMQSSMLHRASSAHPFRRNKSHHLLDLKSLVAQVLGHRKVKYPEQRSMSGRLLYWDHLQDQLSYLLCQPEDGDESQEPKGAESSASSVGTSRDS